MRYALLIYHEPDAMDHLAPEEREPASREFFELAADPACSAGGHLEPVETATTLRERDGNPLVTAGPFADTKEVLGGFYIVEAPDIDAATELARRVPITRYGGAVELRPLAAPPAGS